MEALPVITHPFHFFIPGNAAALFLGTFPPPENRWSYPFFYPNKRNRFWEIMAAVGGYKFLPSAGEEALSARMHLAESLGFGLSDMGYSLRRLKGNASDENLEIVQLRDVQALLLAHPHIRGLAFTSSSGRNSSWGWFRQYLSTIGCPAPRLALAGPRSASLFLAGRELSLTLLPSPSPRAANHYPFTKMVELYGSVLGSGPANI